MPNLIGYNKFMLGCPNISSGKRYKKIYSSFLVLKVIMSPKNEHFCMFFLNISPKNSIRGWYFTIFDAFIRKYTIFGTRNTYVFVKIVSINSVGFFSHQCPLCLSQSLKLVLINQMCTCILFFMPSSLLTFEDLEEPHIQ